MLQANLNQFKTNFTKGSIVFNAGDPPDAMYFIESGKIEISLETANTKHVLTILVEGEFFGEMGLFTGRKRSGTATAIEDSQILKIERGSIEHLMGNKKYMTTFISKMSDRLYHADQQIEELVFISKEIKILQALAYCWRENGKKDARGEKLLVRLEQFNAYLKKWLNMEKDEVMDALLYLQKKEVLKLGKSKSGKKFIIFAPGGLRFFELIFSSI